MFGKVSSDDVRCNFNKAKNSIGNKYVEGQRLFHNIDHGVKIAKKVYGAVAPVINSLAGNETVSRINKHAMKAISEPGNIRQSVMEGHDQAEAHAAQAMTNFKKSGVSTSL